MATTKNVAGPKKSGFQGVRDAIWIIVICFAIAFCFYQFGQARHCPVVVHYFH